MKETGTTLPGAQESAVQTAEEVKRVLVMGAGGFVGGFAVEEALRRGYEVWAGVRETTSRADLNDPRIHFIVFDFEHPESFAKTLRDALPEGKWDYIVYNLGATKVLRYADFNRINHDYLRAFTGALTQSGMIPEKLLFMSSLSAMGPGDEKHYAPFTETRIPMPDTRYGASKLKAEMWLATSGIPHIIFRATGVYGPRDHDYFLEFKSLATGFDFQVGMRRQYLSFIYVKDLARAIFDALDKAPAGETYIVSEERAYTQREFRRIVRKALGKRFVMPVRLPLWAVKAVTFVAEKWGVLRNKPSTLNRDKYRILRQRNWKADVTKARRDFGFRTEVPLEEGVAESIAWYREYHWMK